MKKNQCLTCRVTKTGDKCQYEGCSYSAITEREVYDRIVIYKLRKAEFEKEIERQKNMREEQLNSETRVQRNEYIDKEIKKCSKVISFLNTYIFKLQIEIKEADLNSLTGIAIKITD